MNAIVSVAVCTYCGEKYIASQLRSIIAQSHRVDEIIVCDDCSTDRTVPIAESVLCESGIPFRIIVNSTNLGVTGNFEACIQACTGDIIFTADQDDVWASEKVSRLLQCFKDPKLVAAYSDASIIDANGNELHSSLYKRDGFYPDPFTQERFEDAVVRLSQTVYGCTMAFRRSFVQEILPFYHSTANHDAWIMCCAPLFGTVCFLTEPLISYRIHGNNTVASLGGSKVWDAITAQMDSFDRHFALQPLRALRLELLREAIKRYGKSSPSTHYKKNIQQADCLYSRLLRMKDCKKLTAVGLLLCSGLDGSYRFRFCDRGRSVRFTLRVKQFVRDFIFLLHHKEPS